MTISLLSAPSRAISHLRADDDVDRTAAGPGVIARSRRSPVPRWASLVGVLATWQLASTTKLLSPDLLAPPSTIATTGWRLAGSGELGSALLVSSGRIAIGLLFGVTAGVTLGLLSGLSRWGDALLDPPVQALRTLPHRTSRTLPHRTSRTRRTSAPHRTLCTLPTLCTTRTCIYTMPLLPWRSR